MSEMVEDGVERAEEVIVNGDDIAGQGCRRSISQLEKMEKKLDRDMKAAAKQPALKKRWNCAMF